MTINHQWLSTHNYSAVAVPSGMVKFERDEKGSPLPFDLAQRDGSVIRVKYTDHFSFQLDDIPDAFTRALFGIDKDRMRTNILKSFPDFARLDSPLQKLNYLIVTRVL